MVRQAFWIGLMGLCSLSLSQSAVGQTTPVPSDWNIFLGATVARATPNLNGLCGTGCPNPAEKTQSLTGWDLAVSEYPYHSHPWIGGTVEASGNYFSQGALFALPTAPTVNQPAATSRLYTFMGGPSFRAETSVVSPFARFMVGDALVRNTATANPSGPTQSSTSNQFGVLAGGGVDLPASSRVAFRVQVDWLAYWQGAATARQRVNAAKFSFGLLIRL